MKGVPGIGFRFDGVGNNNDVVGESVTDADIDLCRGVANLNYNKKFMVA